MSAKRKSKPEAPPANFSKPVPGRAVTSLAGLEPFNLGFPFTAIAWALLLLAVIVVWVAPGINVDLFAALAGGRDVVAGHLGQPDRWSFITQGRVWLNQNWGGDLIFYLWQHILGFQGLLWLKLILVGACALFALLAARRRKVSWPIALPATALIIIMIRNFVDLRPNLTTLVLAPLELWLLYRTRENPARIWYVAGLILFWANIHGGFIFGLGIMALWMACLLIQSLVTGGMASLKPDWHLLGATIAAVILAGVVSPFGIANVTHPFLMLTEKYWRNVAEWQPIFGGNFDWGNLWEFFAVTGGIFIIGLLRFFLTRKNAQLTLREQPRKASVTKHKPVWTTNTGIIIFELILFLALVIMAFTSRRFIPLALVLFAPVLAMQLSWLTDLARSHGVAIILGLIILILAGGQINREIRYYHPNNPLTVRQTFFEKMNLANHYFPANLASFINDNHIEGNVYCNWEWEGYLRWHCPQLKLFVGGRAQQIYQAAEYELYNQILFSETPGDKLKRLGAPMVACSYSGVFVDLINRLVTGGWVCIYNDNYHCLLVDPSQPPSPALIQKVQDGSLHFRNQTDGLLSRASCLISPAVNGDRSKAIELLKQTVAIRPLSKAYLAFANFVVAPSQQTREVVAFLEQEAKRLETMRPKIPDQEENLICRYWISAILIPYYSGRHMDEQAFQAQRAMRTVDAELTLMHARWDYQKAKTAKQ
jgi:hypothetical protein